MRTFTASADLHGCRADPSRRLLGDHLRARLRGHRQGGGVAGFLARALDLPLTERTLLVLREHPFPSLEQDPILHLPSPMERHSSLDYRLSLPNVWLHASEATRAFLRTDESTFAATLGEELRDPLLVEMLPTMRDIFQAIEASAIGRYPQLHLSIANFRCDAAMPRHVCLDDERAPITARIERHRLAAVTTHVPEIVSALERVRRTRSPYWFRKAVRHLDALTADGASLRTAAVAQALQFILLNKRPKLRAIYRKRRPKLVSIEKYLPAIEHAYDIIRRAQREGPAAARPARIDPVMRRALLVLAEVLDPAELPADTLDALARVTPVLARPFDILHPAAYARYYGLHEPPPDPHEDLARSARRVLASLLVHSGRRAVCVSLATLGDILIGRASDPHVEVRITNTKNPRQAHFRAPLFALWPARELRHLRAFVAAAREGGIPLHTQLMVIARLGAGKARSRPYSKSTTDLAQRRLARGLVPRRRVATHLARINFATWFTIRIWCAHHPWLLSHPLLHSVREHEWFTSDALARLRRHLQPSPRGRIEALRRLMGLATAAQYIERYNRAWPLEMSLWAAIVQRHEARIARLDARWSRIATARDSRAAASQPPGDFENIPAPPGPA